ncbi:MAG: DNA topoisomerase 4 subunit A [Clostridia bacterium]|nr:DNA topoisomerase 4 subunit A [Clostridia bacterium]
MAKKTEIPIQPEDKVLKIAFEDVMHNSMLPYAESVILDRALPRVEDGLKPVQRRILYAMQEGGYTPDKPYKKCAAIVGDVLGKYHPHGDTSVYDALVRMAQPFSLRMTLIDGHGNFGSIDGDTAAAYRYTEARLNHLATEILRDIDKETVDWQPNFDDSREEPVTLPCRFPNLLVNGTTGIAVGISTDIPTHNLSEAINATIALIDNPKMTTAELLQYIPGPDFPTGGTIYPVDSFESIYETGRGKIMIRSRYHTENDANGKKNIVITEIPYGVNKAKLLVKIAELREQNKDILGDIVDVVDESDKQGIRGVIKLRKDAKVEKIIQYLLKKTDLEISYNYNMYAIANGKPELLSLKAILGHYIEYQKKIIVRRTTYNLKAAKNRANILRGLIIAIQNIDEVIQIIKASESTPKAKLALRERYSLDDDQAQAIVDMRLKSLTHLEADALRDELAELEKKIANYEAILGSVKRQYGVIKEELLDIKKRMGIGRMSTIVGAQEAKETQEAVPTAEESIAYRDGVLVLDSEGALKLISQKSYIMGMKNRDSYSKKNIPVQAITVNNKGTLFAFTNLGNVIKVDVNDLPDRKWSDKGAVVNTVNREGKPGEVFVKVIFFPSTPVGKFVFYTKGGYVKMSDIEEYCQARPYSLATIVQDKDVVINVEVVDEEKNILEVTEQGQCLVYPVSDVPVQGKKAGGVRGIKLNDEDSVVYAGQIDEEGEIVVATNAGYVKRVIASMLDPAGRYQKGVKLVELDNSVVEWIGLVKMPYDIAFILPDDSVQVMNTEDIQIDTRTTKGRKFYKSGLAAVISLEDKSQN